MNNVLLFMPKKIGGVRFVHEKYRQILLEAGYQVHCFEGLGQYMRLNRSIKRRKLTFFSTPFFWPLLFCRGHDLLFILHGFPAIRSMGWLRFSVWCCIIALINKRKIQCVAVSNFTHAINHDIFGLSNIKVVTNSVESQNALRKKETRTYDLCFVGRSVPIKGFEEVYKALTHLEEAMGRAPSAVFILAGEVSSSLLDSRPKSVDFRQNLEREEIMDILENSRWFISLNRTEPFGLVYLEAMSCGCRIIAPNTGGAFELLSNYSGACLIDSDFNYLAIADVIEKQVMGQIDHDRFYAEREAALQVFEERQKIDLLTIVSEILHG